VTYRLPIYGVIVMKALTLLLTLVLGLAATSLQAQTVNKIWRLGVLSPIDFEPIRGLTVGDRKWIE
jgi:hypothetical protein